MLRLILAIVLFSFLILPFDIVTAIDLKKLAGRILLQVEENGEAWYVSPGKLERYFLGRPSDAFFLMREKGVGISNFDLEKIPLGLDVLSGFDTDGDGLPDEFEKSIGTDFLLFDTDGDGVSDLDELKAGMDPRNDSPLFYNNSFVAKNLGRIFLQVESRGEAWYVFPQNGKRYFLGRPDDAFALMRKLGLGISNDDLDQLIAYTPSFEIIGFEKKVHDLVNIERINNGLAPLALNPELSQVAREHSQSLTRENRRYTSLDAVCSYPLIHHEGLDFGFYNADRLKNRDIRYLSMSGENIALLSSAKIYLTYEVGEVEPNIFDDCYTEQQKWDDDFKKAIDGANTNAIKEVVLRAEIEKRERAHALSPRLEISSAQWIDSLDLAKRAVDGWMNSPGHRKNILQSEYNEAGLGIALVNSYVIFTQVFIKRIDCGYAGATCCERPDYIFCYEPNTCNAGICQ